MGYLTQNRGIRLTLPTFAEAKALQVATVEIDPLLSLLSVARLTRCCNVVRCDPAYLKCTNVDVSEFICSSLVSHFVAEARTHPRRAASTFHWLTSDLGSSTSHASTQTR
jgi:hypothetical protein